MQFSAPEAGTRPALGEGTARSCGAAPVTDLDLYNKKIKELAGSIPREGRLADPDASATARSRICGSRATVDLKIENGIITDYAQELRACVIGQAVGSIVGRVVVGLSVAEVHAGAQALRELLSEKKLPETDPWTALEPLIPVADVRSRHGSAMVPFEALEKALNDAVKRTETAAAAHR